MIGNMTAPNSRGGFYVGHRDRDGGIIVTRPDGSPLPLDPSLALWRHSPTGFQWGYLGSGPAQLALALLLDATGEPATAVELYQRFKAEVVSGWTGKGWALDHADVVAWAAEAAAAEAIARA